MKKKLVVLLCSCMVTAMLAACGNASADVEVTANSDVESEQESTSKEEAASTEEEEKAVLSDDLWSYQVSVNGEIYQIPMWYEELEALGWEFTGNSEATLDSGASTQWPNSWKNGDNSISTFLRNMASNSATYAESQVVYLSIDNVYLREGEWEVILPGGIQMGVATKEDIIAAYGEPTSQDEYAYSYYLRYTKDLSHNIYMNVDKTSGTLSAVTIENRDKLEGGDDSVSTDVPESVKNYVAPTELGNDLYDMNIEIDGHLYALPCPVAEFTKNGFEWDSNHENGDKEIAAGRSGFAYFNYNGGVKMFMVYNYSPNATTPENCFIGQVTSDSDSDLYELVIPCGIKKGMPESELLEILANYEYEVEEIGDSYKSYYLENPNASADEHYFIGVEDGVVVSLNADTNVRVEY